MLINRDELEASVCRDSFWDFVQRFWDVVIPEDPVWNWHMEFICHEMQEAAERVFRGEPKVHDYIFNVPPGSSKSTIASVMFPIWAWSRMPSARSICGSYTHPLALDLSRRSRNIIRSDKFRRLFPSIELVEDQDAKGYFANRDGGMRYAVGTDGSVTGFHGHFLIIDDPLDPKQAVSDADLITANRWVSETLPSRKVDKKISVTFLIMQRLHQNDPTAVLLERREQGVPVRHVRLPAEITGNGLDVVRPRKLARNYVDGLLDPVRLPRSVLREALITIGQFGYAGQMLQRPVPLGGGMFRIDRVRIETGTPHPKSLRRLVRYWDKAGTEGGGAFTAGVLMGEDVAKRIWILDVVRGQWDSAVRERIIKNTAILDGFRVEVGVEQEPGSGGKESAQNTARNLVGFRVRIDPARGDKVMRADPFSVQINSENVSILAAPWNRAYLEELQFFPHSKFKDQVDASSGAFALLTNRGVRIGGLGRSKVTV